MVRSIPFHQATKAEADADLRHVVAWIGRADSRSKERKKAEPPVDSFLPRRKDGRQRRAARSHGRQDQEDVVVRSVSVGCLSMREGDWRGDRRGEKHPATEASPRS